MQSASTDVGPVLLPGRQARLHRPRFLDELRDRFGATGGPLAQGYVIAHSTAITCRICSARSGAGSFAAGRDRKVCADRAAG